MKNSFLCATILGFGILALPQMADAQYYVPPTAYNGANVVVNMDVLNPAPMNNMRQPIPLTRGSTGMRSPAEARAGVPLRLRRPAARQGNMYAPPTAANMPAPQQAPLVLKQPSRRAVASTPLAPLNPPRDNTITERTPDFVRNMRAPIATPVIAEPILSAKDLVKAAEAEVTAAPMAAMAEAKREIADITPKINETKNRQRELLANAREKVLYDAPTSLTQTASAQTERVISEIENIAPSAPRTPAVNVPMPSPTMLDPITPPALPVVNVPTLPTVAPMIEKPIEMAALTTPTLPTTKTPNITAPSAGQNSLRLVFDQQAAELSASDAAALDQVAARITNSNNTKIQLRAFANGTPETSSKARRLSLTRALTVRSYLMDKGVSATSMDVRALGIDKSADAPSDRVDIVFVQ